MNTNLSEKIIIKFENISKSFGSHKVLKNLSLNINRGDCLAIIGPNGSGKSTLLEIMIGFVKSDSGKVIYNFEKPSKPRDAISMQFQEVDAPSGIKAKDLITFFIKSNRNILSQQEIDKYIKLFEIDLFLNRNISKLSGGQKQKINILLCLITNPEVLVFDEMSTGLDIKAKTNLLRIIKNIHQTLKKTIILISHSSEEIEELANRVVLLDDGVIKENLSIQEIIDKYKKVSTFLVEKIAN